MQVLIHKVKAYFWNEANQIPKRLEAGRTKTTGGGSREVPVTWPI